jgi:lysophospholipase L1-like esterase
MNKKHLFIAAAAVLSLAACKPRLDTGVPSAANLDFTRYIAVGNSLTAGYSDGSLYRSGQKNSYPAILAAQFAMLGGGDFRQPLLNAETGYPGAKRILGVSADCQGVSSLGPVLYPGPRNDTAGDAANIASGGPYNNLGVPGIMAVDFLMPGYALFAKAFLGAPYASRFFVNPATDRPLDMVKRSNPTFFTAWIGNNDVLLYALAGGAGSPIKISPTPAFSVAVDSVVNALTAYGAEGALINIPDVTAIPYFTTVPYNGLVLSRQGQVDSLNFFYAGSGITFKLGQNPFVVQDLSVPLIQKRALKPGEFVTLTVPQDSLKCAGWGSLKPIPASYVLDAGEISAVRNATAAFNGIIQQAAASHGLAYVDMNSYLKTLNAGIVFNGVTMNTVFVRGGAFSLDGVHLTPRGYALAANEIIRSINAHYGASVPMADVNNYNGVLFP